MKVFIQAGKEHISYGAKSRQRSQSFQSRRNYKGMNKHKGGLLKLICHFSKNQILVRFDRNCTNQIIILN